MQQVLIGSDGEQYTVTVQETPDGILCQPWSFTGHAFQATNLEDAAGKVAEIAKEGAQ
jgi:hypothetical protein